MSNASDRTTASMSSNPGFRAADTATSTPIVSSSASTTVNERVYRSFSNAPELLHSPTPPVSVPEIMGSKPMSGEDVSLIVWSNSTVTTNVPARSSTVISSSLTEMLAVGVAPIPERKTTPTRRIHPARPTILRMHRLPPTFIFALIKRSSCQNNAMGPSGLHVRENPPSRRTRLRLHPFPS